MRTMKWLALVLTLGVAYFFGAQLWSFIQGMPIH